MNDTTEPHVAPITAADMRQRIEELYTGVGECVQSLKTMAYMSGGMDTSELARELAETVRKGDAPPTSQPLDQFTLNFVASYLYLSIQQAMANVVVTEVAMEGEPGTETMPPGTKPN